MTDVLVIDCDECVMQHTAACDDCVVTALCGRGRRRGGGVRRPPKRRCCGCLSTAGLVPGAAAPPAPLSVSRPGAGRPIVRRWRSHGRGLHGGAWRRRHVAGRRSRSRPRSRWSRRSPTRSAWRCSRRPTWPRRRRRRPGARTRGPGRAPARCGWRASPSASSGFLMHGVALAAGSLTLVQVLQVTPDRLHGAAVGVGRPPRPAPPGLGGRRPRRRRVSWASSWRPDRVTTRGRHAGVVDRPWCSAARSS